MLTFDSNHFQTYAGLNYAIRPTNYRCQARLPTWEAQAMVLSSISEKYRMETGGQVHRSTPQGGVAIRILATTRSENYEFGNPSTSYKLTHIVFPCI